MLMSKKKKFLLCAYSNENLKILCITAQQSKNGVCTFQITYKLFLPEKIPEEISK